METFYLTPKTREFANLCDYAYQFDGTQEEVELLAEEFDCPLTDAPEWIENLQCRMHMVEACTNGACTCDDEFQEYDENGEYIENCGFQVQAADEFCNPLPSDWKEWLEENVA